MGTPKALLPWGETTLLEHALAVAREAGVEDVVVVLGPATRHMEHDLHRARVAFNPDPATGRSTSIRLGCEALPIKVDLDAVLIQSVDQPASAEVLEALFAAISETDTDITVPTFGGRRGHPICVSGRLMAELRQLTEEGEGLREVVRRHADGLREVPVVDECVVWNLNDPQAYAAARAAAGLP
jgi:molybdenum cofactor cytidylyltransferase